jgi:hypothetical protein
MAQNFNFQTYYTEKEEQLDEDLRHYNLPGINGTPDEFKKPDVFRGLYKLAWDYFALNQDTAHNFVVYGNDIGITAALTVAPGNARPAVIDTVDKKNECIELYCKNMGIVIGAKILDADNLDKVIEWVKDNDVFPATLPLAGVNYRPLAIGAVAVGPTAAQSGAEAIHSYANNFCQAKIATTPALASSIRTELLVRLNAYSAAKLVECTFFQARMVPFNDAGGLTEAATLVAYNAAVAAYVANAPTGLQFNASTFMRDLLLNMTRNTVNTRQTYDFVKKRTNSVPVSFSSFKEIESNIKNFDNQIANVAVAPVQASQKTTGLFTGKGYNSLLDRLKTEMPRRLTHTCYQGCNVIYGGNPPVIRCMVYDRKVYVAPIQTRLEANVVRIGQVAGAINIISANAIPSANVGLAPTIAKQAVFSSPGGVPSIDVLERPSAMPGPNPQPLRQKFNWMHTSTDTPSRCTTNDYDEQNMRNLPAKYMSLSLTKGHGDWQSMPNYATCWLIKHNDKNVTPESTGVKMTTQDASTIEVFPFERKWPFSLASTGNKFTIPKDDSNCMLPTHWEMFALWPTGKLIYRNMQNHEFTVDPPLGTYWKEWRGAVYGPSYMAEIGYQEAKAAYDARVAARTQNPLLTPDEQEELFQMAAHHKMEGYIGTINPTRLAGIADDVGGSGNNKKRYNKKTVMSILKTAKRKYFTRRNNKKSNLY